MSSSNESPPIGLINPGAMGTPVGVAARRSGADVLWVSAGRSRASVARAQAAGFESVDSLAALVERVAVVLSVCPPHAASEVAAAVAELGFKGIFVDANAVSPETVVRMAERLEHRGASFVDGSIIGGPPTRRGTTRLYLSGTDSAAVVTALADGVFDLVDLGARVGDASALKMAYAAWTKGADALLLGIRALARARGVEDALLEEWRQSQPALLDASAGAMAGSVPKAWRFAGEMDEIADTFEATGLPAGFHRAAAEIYRRLHDFKDATAVDEQSVLRALSGRGEQR